MPEEKNYNRLLGQEPCSIEQDFDFFGVHDTIKELIKVLIPNKNNPKFIKDIQIIGLFDAYGEGKSSLIKTLKEQYNNKFTFIEIDLWQYESDEIEHDFHKLFHQQKAKYYKSQRAVNFVYNSGQKVRKFKGVSEILATKRSLEHSFQDDYFSYGFLGLKRSVRRKREKEYKKNTTPVLIFENMDRLSVEKKVAALSSIYNYRDSFQSHIIIALDPDAVRHTTTYFESLINKCFTTYMYLTPKTKYVLKKYIEKQLSKIGNEKITILVDMLLTQHPSSLRELNHCINTFIMSYRGEKNIKLVLFLAILQVHYHQLYRAISQNSYILKKFIYHANDTGFDGYLEYDIKNEERYKLNLLIKSLGDLDVEDSNILAILSPLNKDFFKNHDENTLEDWIIRIELLRKADLEKDVIEKIEKFVSYKIKGESHEVSFEEYNQFFTETVKDSKIFIAFFQSQNFEDIYSILKGIVKETDKISFLEMFLSYSVKGINDYSFYSNYSKVIGLYLPIIHHEKKFSHLLVQRILENFQLTRVLLEDGISLNLMEYTYFIGKLKQHGFIDKILYITYFFSSINSTLDTNSIEEIKHIIESSIRDVDIEKLDKLEQYKQDIVENFYLKDIPLGRYNYATIELIINIIESSFFKRLSTINQVEVYVKIFNNNELINADDIDKVIVKFSKILDNSLNIESLVNVVKILLKIRALDKIDFIHELVLKKFLKDNLEEYGKYDEKLKRYLETLLSIVN